MWGVVLTSVRYYVYMIFDDQIKKIELFILKANKQALSRFKK